MAVWRQLFVNEVSTISSLIPGLIFRTNPSESFSDLDFFAQKAVIEAANTSRGAAARDLSQNRPRPFADQICELAKYTVYSDEDHIMSFTRVSMRTESRPAHSRLKFSRTLLGAPGI